jgi:hypothetical protein
VPADLAVILTVAVAVLAAVQCVLLAVVLLGLRRLEGEVSATLRRVEQAAGEVGALAADLRATVGQARRTAEHIGVLAGAGRRVVEGALGAALLRRLLPAAAQRGDGLASVLAELGGQAVAAAWRAMLARRRSQAQAPRPTATVRPAVRAGQPRRVDAPPSPDGRVAAPPTVAAPAPTPRQPVGA